MVGRVTEFGIRFSSAVLMAEVKSTAQEIFFFEFRGGGGGGAGLRSPALINTAYVRGS